VTHNHGRQRPAEHSNEADASAVSLNRREFFKRNRAAGLTSAASALALFTGDAQSAPADGISGADPPHLGRRPVEHRDRFVGHAGPGGQPKSRVAGRFC